MTLTTTVPNGKIAVGDPKQEMTQIDKSNYLTELVQALSGVQTNQTADLCLQKSSRKEQNNQQSTPQTNSQLSMIGHVKFDKRLCLRLFSSYSLHLFRVQQAGTTLAFWCTETTVKSCQQLHLGGT